MKQAVFHEEEKQGPLQRELSDRARTFQQRDSLLRHLGIVPRLLRSSSILELGAGHGENALFLLKSAPRRMVVVEASPAGAAACAERLGEQRPEETELEIHCEAAAEFRTDERFDLVMFEGAIPFEPDPVSLLQHAAGHVAPGGILAVTCSDAVSFFPEALRRLIGGIVAPATLRSRDRVQRLTPIFAPHLATLAGRTRAPEDWVLDRMIQPWSGRPMSILEATRALAPELDLYGTSPAFLTDWRWFRNVHGERGYLQLAERAYLSNVHNLIDYRYARGERDPMENAELIRRCNQVLDAVRRIEQPGQDAEALLDLVEGDVGEVAVRLAAWAPETAAGLEDCLSVLRAHRSGHVTNDFGRFTGLFGRGQQVVSFLRADEETTRAA